MFNYVNRFAEDVIAADFFAVFHIPLVGYVDYLAACDNGGKHADNIGVAYVIFIAEAVVAAYNIFPTAHTHNPVHGIVSVAAIYRNIVFFQRKFRRFYYDAVTPRFKHGAHTVAIGFCYENPVFF